MATLYHCSHLLDPHNPHPSTYPSSSTSFSPLDRLYFCEECDAIRCDQCVAVEVASFFCPSCLFDVPSANVRGDKNRCARSCFSCPQCASSLAVQATEAIQATNSIEALDSGPPYFLVCPGCKWTSKEIGWDFDKSTGLAMQLQKVNTEVETVQAQFDSLKEHLETYISLSTPVPAAKSRNISRHVSHYTQMAAKAMNKDVPTMRKPVRPAGIERPKEPVEWDDLGEYEGKGDWRQWGFEKGLEEVDYMGELSKSGWEGLSPIEARWGNSWARENQAKAVLPQRTPLQTKSTKRCPHPTCRHLLVQPDTKSTRMKIKMMALNYLPEIEVGRRRRKITTDVGVAGTPEEIERRRRERRRTRGRAEEEDEDMTKPIRAGELYAFQASFTNPLYDPIQIRLTQSHTPRNGLQPNHHIHIPVQHFTVAALKDAWAYDDEEDEEGPDGSEAASEGSNLVGTISSRRSRLSVLGGVAVGSLRDKKDRRDAGIEKRGNVTKVGLEVEVLMGASGPIEIDLEVRYTYRAEEQSESQTGDVKDNKAVKDEYKSFTFWIRMNVGEVL